MVDIFSRILGGKKKAKAPPKKSKEDWTRRLDGFSQTTHDVLYSGDEDLGSAVYAISFAAFREVVGDAWDHLAPKVQLMSEGVFATYTDTGDFFQQPGEDLFLLFFPTRSRDAARSLAREITVDLGHRVMGDHFQDDSGPLVHMAEMALEDVQGRDMEFIVRTLRQKVDAVRRAEREASQPHPEVILPERASPESRFQGSNQVHLRYRPVWDTVVERIVGYRVVPFRVHEGRTVSDVAFHPREAGVEFLTELDGDVLARVAEVLAQAVGSETRLYVPIDVRTVQAAGRALTARLLDGPLGDRIQASLVFEVIGLADPSAASEAAAILDPACGEILLRAGQGGADPAVLAAGGTVGTLWTDAATRRNLYAQTERGMAPSGYLWNVPDRRRVAESLESAVRFMEGPGVAPINLKSPGKIGPLSRAKVLAGDWTRPEAGTAPT